MSSIFDSINAWQYKPFRRMGVTIDEEIYYAKILGNILDSDKDKLILEIGCGNCLISSYLKEKGLNIFSIENWNEEMSLDEIKKYKIMCKLNLIQNLFPLPFRDNSFDVVYSALYFYNVSKSKRKEYIKDIQRVLKNDGKFVLLDVELMRGIRKDFTSEGFKEDYFTTNQGVFISVLKKS
ncbi:methyltransferase domain-containing protein [Acidianus sulfidivorans JP7]|uniref:Methyltransferase type 11 n=1 Tax=Acidianus sulfidivorans JP7 TaxID=619593 RepID=A0A2U9IPH7_9CREN|nr:class I SAM-dependent methyltransferase [Acidianus sulfidivorans]AWR97915.1 methyltransferase domain-containing protein [Acidianus sulfidivorans JP7]